MHKLTGGGAEFYRETALVLRRWSSCHSVDGKERKCQILRDDCLSAVVRAAADHLTKRGSCPLMHKREHLREIVDRPHLQTGNARSLQSPVGTRAMKLRREH